MKKVLLLIISLFIAQAVVWAYETVLVDFPQDEGWHAVYYDEQGNEAILQYSPAGQTFQNWSRAVVFHSYKDSSLYLNAATFLNQTTSQMELKNSSQGYKYLKYTDTDAIATRCIQKNANTPTQCEIYRVSTSYEGLISMHYINKNQQDFKNSYNDWFEIVKNIRIYYSYYRDDRIMDKATTFEI